MCSWVAHHLSVYWLFLGHWCEYSVVPVFRLWSVLVELDLGVSHLVLILVHLAERLWFCRARRGELELRWYKCAQRKSVCYKLSVGVALGGGMVVGVVVYTGISLIRIVWLSRNVPRRMFELDYGNDTDTFTGRKEGLDAVRAGGETQVN